MFWASQSLVRKLSIYVEAYIIRSIGHSVLELVAHINHWRMVKAVPESFDQVIREHNSGLRLGRQTSNQLDQPFHDHSLVIRDLIALNLAFHNLEEGFHICRVSKGPRDRTELRLIPFHPIYLRSFLSPDFFWTVSNVLSPVWVGNGLLEA